MDLSELIKSYTPFQKNVFTAFCINWPLSFTCIFVHEPLFRDFEFHLQLIFSASASIFLVIISYIMISVIYAVTGKNARNLEISALSLLGVVSTFVLLNNPSLYGRGCEYMIHVVKLTTIVFFFFPFALVCEKEYKRWKYSKKKNRLNEGNNKA